MTPHRIAESSYAVTEALEAFGEALDKLASVLSTQAVTAHVASLKADGERIVGAARDEYVGSKDALTAALKQWELLAGVG